MSQQELSTDSSKQSSKESFKIGGKDYPSKAAAIEELVYVKKTHRLPLVIEGNPKMRQVAFGKMKGFQCGNPECGYLFTSHPNYCPSCHYSPLGNSVLIKKVNRVKSLNKKQRRKLKEAFRRDPGTIKEVCSDPYQLAHYINPFIMSLVEKIKKRSQTEPIEQIQKSLNLSDKAFAWCARLAVAGNEQ